MDTHILHLIRNGYSDIKVAKDRQAFITVMSCLTPTNLRKRGAQGLSVTLESDIPIVRIRQCAFSTFTGGYEAAGLINKFMLKGN